MKTVTLIIASALALATSGCGTLQRLGITEDVVATGVQTALEREGLAGTVSDDQVREVIAILRAEERLNEIATEVASQDIVQARIDAAVQKYFKQ